MSWRQVKWLGGIAAALTAIGGAIAFAAPILKNVLDSGPLPVPSRIELAQLASQLQILQRNNSVQTQQLQQVQKGLDFNTLSSQMGQLLIMQHEAGPHPTILQERQIRELKDQINIIRTRLKLPPIQ